MKAKAVCDGRGNAGTGACAVVLYLDDGRVFEKAKRLEPTTNIVAEHLAIQLSVEFALEHGVSDLLIWNDSQTPVNHVLGFYKCKQPHLRPILEKTWELASELHSVKLEWVPREKTSRPDALCREIDKDPVPAAARPRPKVLLPQKNPFLRS